MQPFAILAAVAAAATALATPALAQSPQGTQRIVVSHADLDLSSRAGVARLDRRILTAIQTACGPTSDADLHGQNQARSCRKAAAAQVKAQRDLVLAAMRPAPTMLAIRK
jgi:UrcA family protein